MAVSCCLTGRSLGGQSGQGAPRLRSIQPPVVGTDCAPSALHAPGKGLRRGALQDRGLGAQGAPAFPELPPQLRGCVEAVGLGRDAGLWVSACVVSRRAPGPTSWRVLCWMLGAQQRARPRSFFTESEPESRARLCAGRPGTPFIEQPQGAGRSPTGEELRGDRRPCGPAAWTHARARSVGGQGPRAGGPSRRLDVPSPCPCSVGAAGLEWEAAVTGEIAA